MWEVLQSFLGGAGGAAIVGGSFSIWQWYLNRKAKKEDTAAENQAASCAARGKEIGEIKNMMKILFLADRTILYDRIKFLGKAYIEREWISVEELEDLELMHSVYHDPDKLDGNGFLDNLMKTVRSLELRS